MSAWDGFAVVGEIGAYLEQSRDRTGPEQLSARDIRYDGHWTRSNAQQM